MFVRTVPSRDGFANTCVTLLSVFPKWLTGKESTCNAGDVGSIPGLGKVPGGGNANQLQYSCLESPVDNGAWWATVHGVSKSWTWLTEPAHASLLSFLFWTLLSLVQDLFCHLSLDMLIAPADQTAGMLCESKP